jgi:hypothetical protein
MERKNIQVFDRYIIQLLTETTNDLFLTYKPEITYFKYVYRRHTNFSKEIKKIEFNTAIDVKNYVKITLPKTGDLLNKLYLQVEIPARNFEMPGEVNDFDKIIINDETLKIFIKLLEINRSYYTKINSVSKQNFDIDTFYDNLQTEYNNNNLTSKNETINYTINFLNNLNNTSYIFSETDNSVYNLILCNKTSTITYDNILTNIVNITENNKYFYKYLIKYLYNYHLRKYNNQCYKFAWVKKLGYSIIEWVDVYIGNEKIDRQYGNMLDIYSQLTLNKTNKAINDKLIGNISELNEFNNITKPKYTMIIPLNFWFCQNYALSLPLSALYYNSVSLIFKFREMKNICYIENPNVSDNTSEVEKRYGDDIFYNDNINFSVIGEYIFLDQVERKLFAYNTHKYLIQQTFLEEFVINKENTNLKNNYINVRINNLKHQIKGLIWFLQPTTYYNNSDGFTETKFCDYTIKNVGPLEHCKLIINGYNMIDQEENYFNAVQPYYFFKNSVDEGIYMYWFSLYPQELQPSGSCNLSMLKEFQIDFKVKNNILDYDNTEYKLKVFSINYNILSIENGIGKVLYN